MNVLSLFDGISCAYEGLNRASIKVANYYACEIEKNAIYISNRRHPSIQRPTNDVRELQKDLVPSIDLLIGGSPCIDLSIAKKDRKGLEGDTSCLFYEFVRILKEVKPKWFILENVASMPKKDRDIITEKMGVEPVMFNASLVSAQSRKRLFWTNIKFELPADRGIVLKDILQQDAEVDERMVVKGKAFCITSTYAKVSASEAQIEHNIKKGQRTMVKIGHIGNSDSQTNRVYSTEGKVPTQCKGPSGGALPTLIQNSKISEKIRKLTPIECERLQGLPDDYTEGVANTNRYKVLGNAFNVDVIAHILSALKTNEERNTCGMGTQAVEIPEAK